MMKIAPNDYETMKTAMRSVQVRQPNVTPDTYRQNGIGKDTDKRFRWDLLHASGFNVCSLYHYLNDEHIDTALRRIVSELYTNPQ